MDNNQKKKVVVVGAGPGGIASAMILSAKGFEVEVLEKQNIVGGRCSALTVGDYTFDLGPTFVLLPDIFHEIFKMSGHKLSDYVDMKQLDILYSLHYQDGRNFKVYFDKTELKEEIKKLFPGDEKNYERYFKDQTRKYNLMFPCLQVPYVKWYHYFRPKLLKAVWVMDIFSSVYGVLAKYFKHEDLRIAMAFQAKYLGMSPWECPGPFTILSYSEHAFGVFHPIGGVHKISEAMAEVAKKNGSKIRLGTAVKEILVENGKTTGVLLENGERVNADAVVMNVDFAMGMQKLIKPEHRPKTTDQKLKNYKYSCSTFMVYLGVKQQFSHLTHHNIFFSGNYKKNIEEIFEGKLSEDPSFYVQNPSVTDKTLAKEGKSTLYILVPVPNNVSGINWQTEKKAFRDKIIKLVAEKAKIPNLEEIIEEERIVTPEDWQAKANVYNGAVFNLAHTLDQMLYLRPHNEFEEIPGLYIVGGGTHPGSGLPTILESGRITAEMIMGKMVNSKQ
jgi:phytoene desaturase